MSMLTDQEIEHIAKLGRIHLQNEEKERLKKDLSSILDYIDQLNKVDTSTIEPLSQTTGLVNATRPDKPRQEFPIDEESNELLIGQAPQTHGRLVKVRPVLKK